MEEGIATEQPNGIVYIKLNNDLKKRVEDKGCIQYTNLKGEVINRAASSQENTILNGQTVNEKEPGSGTFKTTTTIGYSTLITKPTSSTTYITSLTGMDITKANSKGFLKDELVPSLDKELKENPELKEVTLTVNSVKIAKDLNINQYAKDLGEKKGIKINVIISGKKDSFLGLSATQKKEGKVAPSKTASTTTAP